MTGERPGLLLDKLLLPDSYRTTARAGANDLIISVAEERILASKRLSPLCMLRGHAPPHLADPQEKNERNCINLGQSTPRTSSGNSGAPGAFGNSFNRGNTGVFCAQICAPIGRKYYTAARVVSCQSVGVMPSSKML